MSTQIHLTQVFPYFNFLGGGQLKKSPCIWKLCKELPHSVVSSLRGYQTLPQEQTRTCRNVHNQHKNTHEQTYWSRLTHSKRDRTTHIDRGKGSKNPGQGDYNGDNVQMLTTKCQLIPDICHFFSTYVIFGSIFLHTKVRKSRHNLFRKKIA